MNKQEYLDKLKAKRPSVFEEYNYDLLPVTIAVVDKIQIRCYKHGIFTQQAATHLHTTAGCRTCGNIRGHEKTTMSTDKFISRSKAKFGNLFTYSNTTYVNRSTQITITCHVHGDVETLPYLHLNYRYGCPKCNCESTKSANKTMLIERSIITHAGKYDYSRVDYVNSNDSVEIICPTHGSFYTGLHNHSTGVRCMQCTRDDDRLTLEEFISKSRDKHGDRYSYRKVEYVTNASMVIIICPKHGEFTQRAASHLAGCRCKQCYIEDNWIDVDKFINDAKSIHGSKYDYSKVIYIGSKKKVEIICPIHGSFWKSPNSHISSRSGCRSCIESKGEVAIKSILAKYSIKFIQEYKIQPYQYRYDFYLPELHVFIEYNGHQHYKPVDVFGGKSAHLKTVKNDKIKNQLVRDVAGHLVTISYKYSDPVSIEKELIRYLKCIYKYWFIVDGEIKVFKSALAVYKAFNIPLGILAKDLVVEVVKTVPNCRILF